MKRLLTVTALIELGAGLTLTRCLPAMVIGTLSDALMAEAGKDAWNQIFPLQEQIGAGI